MGQLSRRTYSILAIVLAIVVFVAVNIAANALLTTAKLDLTANGQLRWRKARATSSRT